MLLSRTSCRFGTITSGLIEMLRALELVGRTQNLTLIVLSGTDGQHGADKGHALATGHDRGEALDVRCRELTTAFEKSHFIHSLVSQLGQGYLISLEHEGTANEHYHLQVRPPARRKGPL